MPFILFMLLFASFLLAVVSFSYPLVLVAIFLQFLILIISALVLTRRIKKKKSYIGTAILTLMHTGFLVLIVSIFLMYSIQQHEKGDLDGLAPGFRKMTEKLLGMPPEEFIAPQHPDMPENLPGPQETP